MKTIVGLWIDHRKAVMTRISDQGEETKVIAPNIEKHRRQREFPARLQGDDSEVIAAIGDADSILFFGPAKVRA